MTDEEKELQEQAKAVLKQMKALKDVVCWDSKMYYMKGLRALYNDLKKL